MKMLTVIVNKKDAPALAEALSSKGFMFTEIGSTGGFLRAGNTTIILGVDDARLDEVLDIIRVKAGRRVQSYQNYGAAAGAGMTEILIGGATVFVTSVDRFEKL